MWNHGRYLLNSDVLAYEHNNLLLELIATNEHARYVQGEYQYLSARLTEELSSANARVSGQNISTLSEQRWSRRMSRAKRSRKARRKWFVKNATSSPSQSEIFDLPSPAPRTPSPHESQDTEQQSPSRFEPLQRSETPSHERAHSPLPERLRTSSMFARCCSPMPDRATTHDRLSPIELSYPPLLDCVTTNDRLSQIQPKDNRQQAQMSPSVPNEQHLSQSERSSPTPLSRESEQSLISSKCPVVDDEWSPVSEQTSLFCSTNYNFLTEVPTSVCDVAEPEAENWHEFVQFELQKHSLLSSQTNEIKSKMEEISNYSYDTTIYNEMIDDLAQLVNFPEFSSESTNHFAQSSTTTWCRVLNNGAVDSINSTSSRVLTRAVFQNFLTDNNHCDVATTVSASTKLPAGITKCWYELGVLYFVHGARKIKAPLPIRWAMYAEFGSLHDIFEWTVIFGDANDVALLEYDSCFCTQSIANKITSAFATVYTMRTWMPLSRVDHHANDCILMLCKNCLYIAPSVFQNVKMGIANLQRLDEHHVMIGLVAKRGRRWINCDNTVVIDNAILLNSNLIDLIERVSETTEKITVLQQNNVPIYCAVVHFTDVSYNETSRSVSMCDLSAMNIVQKTRCFNFENIVR
ncbi:hypothetical protein EAI_02619 [Harpegnathos saltator]|uniref:Uncharacterized protein n=1 Tax=Harpegnathos saltator TaxID=610380 RepID=E2C7V8_HARSA|nr:hypothetical protein EAI_02619 [Harpegnathos saltator]